MTKERGMYKETGVDPRTTEPAWQTPIKAGLCTSVGGMESMQVQVEEPTVLCLSDDDDPNINLNED